MPHLSQADFLWYETTTCIFCGIEICLPKSYIVQRRRDHETFYCPNGHGQCYSDKSDVEQLRETLATETKKREWAEQGRKRAEEAKEKAQRSAAAYKGKFKRVVNGVCPCCNRHFANIERHMATKHPEHGTGNGGDND